MRVLHVLCKGQLQEICCVPLRALLLRDLVHQWNKKGALEKCSNPMLLRARRLRASCQKSTCWPKASASTRWPRDLSNDP